MKRSTWAVIIALTVTGLLVLLPVGLLVIELVDAIRYGWPGEWHNEQSAANGAESLFGVGLAAVLVFAILTAGTLTAWALWFSLRRKPAAT